MISPKIHHPFKENYRELSELVESTAEQVVNYQMSLAATTVLHDAASQNWTESKVFYEGERISHCIQMWWYYLQGLHYDLWNSLPPKIASNMFAKVTICARPNCLTKFCSIYCTVFCKYLLRSWPAV